MDPDLLEESVEYFWYDAFSAFGLFSVHRMGLAGTCLSIGKDGGMVA